MMLAGVCLESGNESRSVVFNSLPPHGLYSPWNSPGQNTGVGNLSLFQGIFPTQGLNIGLPHCRQILYQLSLVESIWLQCKIPGSISGSKTCPGEGNGNPLQYSCLENPMDGGAWQAAVHEVAKIRTRLSDFTHSIKTKAH